MIQIRYAKAEDYDAVLALGVSMEKKEWEALTKNKQFIFVFDGGETAGFLQYGISDNVPFISRLFLPEKYQHCGLGTGLMKFWECEMGEHGHKKLMLLLDEKSQAKDFFAKLGYKLSDSAKHNKMIMEKEIDHGYHGCCNHS